MDLVSGRYTVNRNNPSPFQLNGFESISVSNARVDLIIVILFVQEKICVHNNKTLH